ncbi:MAG: DNA helicase RecG, partial [Dehalococcoidales bacterium]|nr:DNA helicase RecG [Dehalococcoidales bacterium]
MINIEPLRKILELEHKKGYVDSAVIGGLDRFLNNWAGQAVESITSPHLLNRFHKLLVNPNYASLTKQQRKQWVNDVLNFLAELEGKGEAKLPEEGIKLPPVVSRPSPPARGQGIDSPITVIRGISSSLATKFNKLGVNTVRDLLYFFPRRHLDYSQRKFISQLSQGEEQTIIANVWQAQVASLGGRRGTEAIVGDESGNVRVVWFNQPYLAKKLVTNTKVVISGRVSLFSGWHVFESPEWELVEDRELIHTGRLVPLYPLTQGLRPRQVRKLMKEVVDQWAWQVEDFLPYQVRRHCNLLELPQAITQAHYPENEEVKAQARVRLAFDELFLLQMGVLARKRDWQENQPGCPFRVTTQVLDAFLKSLPFELTIAQQKVLNELLADLEKPRPMSRLLQGEVGSGK